MMVRSKSPLAVAVTVLKYALLTLGAIIMIAPFLDMFLGALRSVPERLARPPVYWPQHPEWSNFAKVFTEMPMLQWGINSVVVTLSVTFLQVLRDVSAESSGDSESMEA